MLYTYTDGNKVSQPDKPIVFDVNGVITGTTVTHEEESPIITLNKPGYYMVQFTGSAIAGCDNGVVKVQLHVDGKPYEGAYTSEMGENINTERTVCLCVIVQVPRTFDCCKGLVVEAKELTFVSLGINVNWRNVVATVTKIA